MKLLLATRSHHKAGEIRRILSAVDGLELLTLDQVGIPETEDEESIEAFETFEENALAKARHFHGITGLATLADDSGIGTIAAARQPAIGRQVHFIVERVDHRVRILAACVERAGYEDVHAAEGVTVVPGEVHPCQRALSPLLEGRVGKE